MTDPARLHQHINAAIEHIDWCTKPPHTLTQVIGIYAEATADTPRTMGHGLTNDEILASIASRAESRGQKGSHSDPTPRAALWGHADAVDDTDETLGGLRASAAHVIEAATRISDLCAGVAGEALWRPPSTWEGLDVELRTAATGLHRCLPNIAATHDVHDLSFLVRVELLETAVWLHAKAEGIWLASKGETKTAAVQRERAECSHCAGWRRGTMATTKGLCEQCANFQYHHKCKPTEAVVRRWEVGRGATPGQINEAKAASRKKVKAG